MEFGVLYLEAFNCKWSACNFAMTTRTCCLKAERTSGTINWNEGTSLRIQLVLTVLGAFLASEEKKPVGQSNQTDFLFSLKTRSFLI